MKGALVLLFVSVVGGALVAAERNGTLRERVESMRVELERLAQPARTTLRFYDVRGILQAPPVSEAKRWDLNHSDAPQLPEEAFREPLELWQERTLLDFVAEALGLDAELRLESGILSARGAPEAHARIENLLRTFEERSTEGFAVEVRIESGDDTLDASSFRAFNGRSQAWSSVRTMPYLADYDVEAARESGIGDPIPADVIEGLFGDALLCLDAPANGVLAHFRINWQKRSGSTRRVDTEHGPMELPSLDVVRFHNSAWLPLGRDVVVATCERGVTPCRIIVRVTRTAAR